VSNAFSRSVSPEVAYHRAGGRRRYNVERQIETIRRQAAIIAHLTKNPFCGSSSFRGINTRLAKMFGVSRQTIHRDISAIMFPWKPQSFVRVVDARFNYEDWWQIMGKHSSWWSDTWFGRWWEEVVPRNQDRIILKSLGGNRYKRGLARKEKRKES